ncbi:MAG: hypothetical protein H7257_12055, partial [Taibaiella sp.]|nr:hypothetical protein [Taibaiella sp.]
MRKFIAAIVLLFCTGSVVFGQHTILENYKWAFGYNCGVDFISGSPVAFRTNITTNEGSASVSDASGGLLFYTDGRRVWDRTNTVMASGGSLVSFATTSTSQGSLIIPVIGNPNQYYLFSLEDYSGAGRLYYCIIDMTLSGGFGDVVSGTIGTLLVSAIGERMCAVQGNNCDIWLVTHKKGNNNFYCYDITAAGIGSPVVSTVGSFTSTAAYNIGQLRASPDRQKLGSTSYGGGSYSASTVGTELFDFDPSTGIVSNNITLDSLNCPYGIEFSPDNTKLYVCPTGFSGGGGGGAQLFQFDLSAGSATAIRASRTTINSVSSACYPTLKLGPDNKIYMGSMTGTTSTFLDCITSPNTAGTGCGFSSRAVTLLSSTTSYFGLPNLFVTVGSGDTTTFRRDTVACIPTTSGTITIGTAITGTGYTWNDGVTTQTRTITAFGTYWVAIVNGCHIDIDTIVVTRQTPTFTNRIHDTAECALRFPITLSV